MPKEHAESSGFLFANLSELREVIAGWRGQGDEIDFDRRILPEAADDCGAPAEDVITRGYLTMLSDAFQGFTRQNESMSQYAQAHIDSLSGCLETMASGEDVKVAGMRKIGFPRGGGE